MHPLSHGDPARLDSVEDVRAGDANAVGLCVVAESLRSQPARLR